MQYRPRQNGVVFGAVAVAQGNVKAVAGLFQALPAPDVAMNVPFAVELGVKLHDAERSKGWRRPGQPILLMSLSE